MPVRVCIVGCMEAARCERSVDAPVLLPLTMTISDVRARGAAISAAIWSKKNQEASGLRNVVMVSPTTLVKSS
jgi:hypothetical protein